MITSIGIKDYVFSILFWLDILSTLSILMDIEAIKKTFFGHPMLGEDALLDTTYFIKTY